MPLPEINDIPGLIRFTKWIKDKLWNYNIDAEGFKVKLTNKTGAVSVIGTIVRADTTTDMAFDIAPINSDEPIGIVAENGIADGDECFIIVGGVAQVLLEDTTASTRGNWVMVSGTAGRADATNANPVGVPSHWREIGHCLESKGAGTNVLAKVLLHFN